MPKTYFLGRTPALTVRVSEGDARFVSTHVLEVADLLRELRVKLVHHAVQYQHLDILRLRFSQSAATHFCTLPVLILSETLPGSATATARLTKSLTRYQTTCHHPGCILTKHTISSHTRTCRHTHRHTYTHTHIHTYIRCWGMHWRS